MAEHTPGPWTVAKPTAGYRAPDEEDHAIIAANLITPAFVYDLGKEGTANALLIAAAPDMLAALNAIAAEWDEFPGMEPSDESLEKVHAAIAKAEGRA